MFSTIVVGTDGSETATKAVGLAVELARLTGARLHTVSAYELPKVAAPMGAADPSLGEATALGAAQGSAAAVLADIQKGAGSVVVEPHEVMAPPADAILQVAREVTADLIVVGSKGMHRRLLGSIPNSVAHNAPCDVLIAKTT